MRANMRPEAQLIATAVIFPRRSTRVGCSFVGRPLLVPIAATLNVSQVHYLFRAASWGFLGLPGLPE